jgi:ATP:ADP antiporter, AAA family
MATGLYKFFNIEKDERTIVSVLLLQSVFLGIFAGAFDVGAHTLFLRVFDASLIPGAFVLSGITGIIITSVYTKLQGIMKFSSFMILNLGFVALATILLRLAFIFTESDKLVYIVFVLMGPLTIISFLGFWGNVSRIFTLRQGKRLFGMVDTGQIIGIIISSYSIPVLMSLMFPILNTLLISSASIIIALAIQLLISRKAQFKIDSQLKIEKKKKSGSFFSLFKVPYTRLITFFILFSVVAAFFIHYSFITVTQINYPEPQNLASFLGAFMGTLMVFTIVIKTFLYGKLMKTYGLRFALLVSPILLGIFTLIALTVGSIYGIGKGSAGFTLFFLVLALSKLFVKSLKDSIEVPSSKILYQSIDPEIRYDVQAKIDGTVNEISAFFSGLLLAGLGLLAAINLVHYSAVLLIVIVLWLTTGILLYKSYRSSLYEALKSYRKSSVDEFETESDESIQDKTRIFYSLKLLPQLWNGFFTSRITNFLNDKDSRISEETSILIKKLGISDEELQAISTRNIQSGTLDAPKHSPGNKIQKLLNSSELSDRMNGIYQISRSDNKNLQTRLIPLFRDYDPVIKASAIRSAGFAGNKDIVHYLVDMLEDKEHYAAAYHALLKIGPAAIDSFENAFYKSGISEKGLKRITRALAVIDSPEKFKLLLNKLEHPNITIVNEVVQGLIRSDYHISTSEMLHLIPILRKIVEIAARNFSILVSLKIYLPDSQLLIAMEEEYKDNIDAIFSFLSLAYDSQSIQRIRQNYESGTAEGIGFAIELLDLLIDDSIKPFLFPLFEDNAESEKVKSLQAEYPVEIQKSPEVLFTILNSSLNQISYYARVCALQQIYEMNDFVVNDQLIAQAFHPNKAIRETATDVIRKHNPALLPDISRRADIQLEEDLDKLHKNQEIRKILILEKSNVFSSVKRKLLPEFAYHFQIEEFNNLKNVKILELFSSNDAVMIFKGELIIKLSTGSKMTFNENGVFLISDIINKSGLECQLNSTGSTGILKISEDELKELFFDYEPISKPIIDKLVKKETSSTIKAK